MRKRVVIFFVMIMGCFCMGMVCVYRTSFGNTVREANLSHGTYKVDIAKFRGSIYDCNLDPFLYRDSEKIASVVPSMNSVVALENIFPPKRFQSICDLFSSGTPFKLEVGNIPLDSEDIKVFDVPKRYPENMLAPHIIGYVNDAGKGICGIEEAYDYFLGDVGSEISVRYKIDALGRMLKDNGGDVINTSCLKSRGLVLTIDKKIQAIAEKAARKFIRKGAVVIAEVPSCKIRACVSWPTFSCVHLEDALNATDSPFLDRALLAYNLGSVYKLVTAATALESGIGENFTFNCTGAYNIEGTNFHCDRGCAHGQENLEDAIAKSCNTYFVELSKKIKPEKLLEISNALGFGKELLIAENFSTDKGNLPAKDELTDAYALANLSFGQGTLLASPVQVVGMINAIASDGKYTIPSIVEGFVNENREYIQKNVNSPSSAFSAKTARCLRKCMIESVERGTSILGKPENCNAGAKTATAETGIMREDHLIVQTWYAGFFPSENPKYVAVVFVEDGESGGRSCAPVFKFIVDLLKSNGVF